MRNKVVIAALASALSLAGSCGGTDPQPRYQAGSGGVLAAGAGGTAGLNAGSGGSSGMFGNPNGGSGGFAGDGTIGPVEECKNLQCQQLVCSGTQKTTISGKVYDPAGRNPLYNVVVYVPNEPVMALPTGATCDECDALYTGNPIATALTDATGSFVLEDAPEGMNIPLVIQVGKWRRQYVVPSVAGCQDNPMEDGMLRLPRNRSEGDIPNIAISTGSADTLECLLRRIGVDVAEYVPGGGDGRVQIFQGSAREMGGGLFGMPRSEPAPNTAPAAPTSPAALWSSVDSLLPYDIVLLSCEGQETLSMNQQALFDYANAGGRVFASHFHYSWFNSGPFGTANLATWMPGSNDLGTINGTIITQLPSGEPFPKGEALRDWLTGVGALQGGVLPVEEARFNATVEPTHAASQSWITTDGGNAQTATQYFSFNTPIGGNTNPDGPQYCGRVVYSDLHVGAASGDDPTQPVPTSCADRDLSPQEAALEFMLFDLSSCVTPDDVPPKPPVVE